MFVKSTQIYVALLLVVLASVVVPSYSWLGSVCNKPDSIVDRESSKGLNAVERRAAHILQKRWHAYLCIEEGKRSLDKVTDKFITIKAEIITPTVLTTISNLPE